MIEIEKNIENKTILITGGTGSFGDAVIEKLLKLNPKKVIVLSRDEKKQFDMGNKYGDGRLKMIIGDVREKDSVDHTMSGVDYVFHAAALKQVPSCEFFPIEAIKTNTMGAYNVLNSAIENDVERLVVLSTDKAVHPVNVMGMTKALMERTMIALSREKRSRTILCGTRYGNVMYTRGSVIPFFIESIKEGKPIKVTDPGMTRFLMPLEHSIDLVLYALANGNDGEIYVRKSPGGTIGNLAEAVAEIFNYDKEIEEMGVRPGEKTHEELISREEVLRTEDKGDYYLIKPEAPGMDYRDYYFKGIKDGQILPEEGYTSANTEQLEKERIKELLLSLKEVQEELKNFKS